MCVIYFGVYILYFIIYLLILTYFMCYEGFVGRGADSQSARGAKLARTASDSCATFRKYVSAFSISLYLSSEAPVDAVNVMVRGSSALLSFLILDWLPNLNCAVLSNWACQRADTK